MIASKMTRWPMAAGLALLLGASPIGALAADGAQASLTLGVVGSLSGVDVKSGDSVQSTGLNSDRKWGLGATAFFDAPIAPMFSLAFGGMYIQRTFEIGNDTLAVERKVPTLFLPLEARVWFGDVLYAAGGVFGAFRVGDQEDRLLRGSNTVFSFSSDSRDAFEYGWTAAAGLNLPLSGRTGLTFEARYLSGMTDASKSSLYEERIRDLAVTAGLRLGM